jgi:hypothetical protein
MLSKKESAQLRWESQGSQAPTPIDIAKARGCVDRLYGRSTQLMVASQFTVNLTLST